MTAISSADPGPAAHKPTQEETALNKPAHNPAGFSTPNETADKQDMLSCIFEMQTELNNYVFSNNSLKDNSGQILSMERIFNAINNHELGVNELPNQWLKNYGDAMKVEVEEFQEELLWKWWSKDKIDLRKAQEELIDILHFLVSAMICAGLTPEKVYQTYREKHAVNIQRQNNNYRKAEKS